MIEEDLTINSDKPMGLLKGRRNSKEFLDQIKDSETINLKRPIGSLEGRIQLA